MITVFDGLTATLISGAVILMLFSMHKRVTRVSVEQTGMYAAKSQAIEFGKWMQRDLSHVDDGNCDDRGVTAAQNSEVEAEASFASWTEVFEFRYCRSSSSDTVRVRYAVHPLVEGGSEKMVKVQRGSDVVEVPVLQLERTVDGIPDGESPPLLTSFQITALGATGDELDTSGAGAPDSEVRFLRLQFSTTRPYKAVSQEYFQEVNWMTSIPMQ